MPFHMRHILTYIMNFSTHPPWAVICMPLPRRLVLVQFSAYSELICKQNVQKRRCTSKFRCYLCLFHGFASRKLADVNRHGRGGREAKGATFEYLLGKFHSQTKIISDFFINFNMERVNTGYYVV